MSISFLSASRAAVTFLTRFPVGGFPFSAQTWSWACAWFPIVGLALGAIHLSFYWILSIWLPPFTTILIVIGLGIMITGGLHEDGLADSADALGGGYDQESIVAILKDSRVGAFGVLALILVIQLKIQLLTQLASQFTNQSTNELNAQIIWGFILGQSLSRGACTCLLFWFPYHNASSTATSSATSTSVSKSKSAHLVDVGTAQLLFSLFSMTFILALSIAFGLPIQTALWITGLLTLVNGLLGRYFCAKAGGLTGDFLGCAQQISEICILLALILSK